MTNEGKEGRWDYSEGDDSEQYYDKSELEKARTRLDAEKGLLDKTEHSRFPVKGGMDYQEGGEDFGEWDNDKPPMSSLDKEKYELEGARHDMQMQKNFINPNEMEEDETGFDWQKGGEQEEEPVEKWDKDDDIGRNYAEPTGDDEPLDDDSYWQGRMEEAEEEDDGTTIANSGHRSTFSDYSLGKEYDPVGEPDLMEKDEKKVGDYFDNLGEEEAPDDIDPVFGKAEEDWGESTQKCQECGKDFDVADNEGITAHVRQHREEYGEDFEPSFIIESLAKEDVSVAGPPADSTIPANLIIDDEEEEEIPAGESKANEWIDDDLALDLAMSGNPEYPPSDQNRDALIALGLVDPVHYSTLTPAGADVLGNYRKNKSDFPEERPDIIDDFSQGTYDAFNESKATEEQINSDTYYYDYSDYWKKGDSYQRSGLALQAGISTDLANSEWDDLPADAQAKIKDAGYVTSYEGQGGTYGRSDFMLNPQHEDITTCVVCGRNIDDHSNPNTDYRGMSGTAPATDHYFLGGDTGGSDDKYDFESKATESEWRVHTITHGEVPITLGIQADEIDAVNAVKRMYFDDGFINEGEILGVTKIGESLHGYSLGTESWTVEGEEEEIDLLTQLLDNELEEQAEGDDEEEDIALITQLLAPESDFKEEEHPRDKGKFTSKGGGDSGGKHSETNTKDIIKSIKGGNKDWHAWGRTEKNEELYAELERRNREVPKPTSKLPDKVFRDDPDAVPKMEQKVKYWEDQKDYWTKIIKFPSRDYQTPNQLGDARWFMGTNISTNLRDAKKKLEGIKAQQGRGTDLVRKPTYKDGKKRFYYSEEPKGEPAEEPWQKGGEVYHTLEVGGMSQSFDTYEEMMEYYKNFPEGTWQYSEESFKKKLNEFEDSDRPVSPNSLMRYTEPIDLPTGKNALDQTYGVSEPETPDGQDLTGKTIGEADSEYERIRGLIEMSEMPETIEDIDRWATSWGADKDLVHKVFEQEFGTYEGDEEIIEQKPYKPTYHYYKQHPFGRRAGKQNPFGEATPKIFQTFNSLQGATEQVSQDTLDQAHIWWDNKHPMEQWSDMRIVDRQRAIMAFLRDPSTTLTEGGDGSGRKPTWKSKDPKTQDKHHIGWKNYGIQGYLDKAEKDYEEGKEQFEDPTPWVSIAKLGMDSVKDILFPAKEDHSFSDMTDKELEELGDLESSPHQAEEDTPMNAGKVDIKKIAKNKTLITPAEEAKSEMELAHNDWGNTHPYWCKTCGAGGDDIEDIESHYDLTGHGERRNPSLGGEGGKGSGKSGHQGWMRAIEEEHTYDFCENCSMITEQVNHKCDMCGKKVSV